jgi:hypothetical protein
MTVGPIAVDVTCYPDFLEGQVLTHNDLNLLRDYLYSRWAFQNGCLFGFGVACGLQGTAGGAQLTFSSGFALAQDGRLLQVSAPVAFDWSKIATLAGTIKPSDYGIANLSGSGYTAVLVPDDTKKPVDETCDPQKGCAAHTDQWCEGAQIVFAAGQLTVTGWAADAAFTIVPITIDPKKGPTKSDFNALKTALKGALKSLVPAETIALLDALSLDGPAGVDLMKVGLLNEVLFTLWDYLRCRGYEQQAACCGPSGQAAVALGWADPAKKTWDCTYRHHFQLSTALYLAIQGYRCQDLCSRYIDHILDLIQNFQVPQIPPNNPPNNPPPPHKCGYLDYKLRKCNWRDPHEKIPFEKYPGYVAIDPTRQPHDPGDPAPWERFLAVDDPWATATITNSIDPTNSGLVRLTDYLGFEDKASKTQLDTGISGGVEIVDIAKFNDVPGMQPAVVAAASDTVILGRDANGTVVGTGVVPTAMTLQQVPALNIGVADAKATATKAADDAGKAASSADLAAKQALAVQESFTKYSQKLTGDFGALEQEFNVKLGAAPDVGKLQQAAQLVDKWQEIDKGYQDAQKNLALAQQQLETHTATLEELSRKGEELTQKQTDLAAGVGVQQEAVKQLSDTSTRLNDRVDSFGARLDTQSIAVKSGVDVTKVGAINASIVGTFDALGAALLKAAGPERTAAVKAEVDKAQPAIEALRTEAAGGLPLTETHPLVLRDALSGMFAAVQATGLNKNTNAYRDLNRSVNELSLALGTKVGPTG